MQFARVWLQPTLTVVTDNGSAMIGLALSKFTTPTPKAREKPHEAYAFLLCVCFIDYVITAVPFFPFTPLHLATPPLPQTIPTPSFTSMGHT